MRILYACHQFFPEHYTGTERFTLTLARQMQALGHRVEVSSYACTDATGMGRSPTRGVLWERYAHQRVPVTAWRLEAHEDAGLGGVSGRIGDGVLERAFERFLSENRFDVVHVTHPMRQTPLLRAARRAGASTVLHLTDFWTLCPRGILLRADAQLCTSPDAGAACARHCYDAAERDVLLQRYRDALELVGDADLVIAPSRFMHEVFERLGVDTSRFVDRGYSFDLSAVDAYPRDTEVGSAAPLVIGFLGTLVPHKGVDVLIEAFRRLDHPDVRLHLYGSTFDQGSYGRRLSALSAGDSRIEMCGVYDFEKVGEILRSLDVVVVPSIWYENNPLVVSISHAAGVPVISTDLGGMTEMVIDGVNGLTFRRGDVDDLFQKLRCVVEDRGLLSRYATRLVPPPRVEQDALELEAIYRGLLDGTDIRVMAPLAPQAATHG